METRGAGGASEQQQQQQHHHHHHHHLTDDSLDKYDDAASDLGGGAAGGSSRKRDLDDYDDDDDEYGGAASKDGTKDSKLGHGGSANTKRSRRHNWQQKYESEFGLQAIERDQVSGAVTLAMCGFCKAFGREGKYDELLQSDDATTGESKKRRRRSLTTTKFFRAFRVDNIRSHLQGAHPRRWAEFEMLPKQDAVRARYLQPQGELSYDGLHMVDDVVLSGAALHAESDMAYAHAHAQALASHTTGSATTPALEATAPTTAAATTHHASAAASVTPSASSANGGGHAAPAHLASVQTYLANAARGSFDYEKHLVEQLTLERDKLEFARVQFAKDVELRERELALREKQLEQDRELHTKLRDAAVDAVQHEYTKFLRLADVLRDSIANAVHGSSGSSAGGAAGASAASDATDTPSTSLV